VQIAPGAVFGAAELTADSGAIAAVVQLVRLDGADALAYRPPVEPSGELALPLADLGGLPEHRRVIVQSAGGGPRVTLRYYDADGQELDRTVDTLGEDGARAYPVKEAAVDAASIHVRSEGAPVVAALLQMP